MVAKMGRPPAKNPRKFHTKIRMTKEEYDLLEQCAEMLNTSKTNIIIRGIEEVYSKAKK